MYSVKIRDHMMIAHSLPDPYFGPASGLHGATYVVDAEFFSVSLNPHKVVIDIGRAQQMLGEVLGRLNYQNLDLLPGFSGQLTTTEFLARFVFEEIARLVHPEFTGILRVTLGESHIAWASYEGEVGVPQG